MEYSNKRFTQEEEALLKRAKGTKLLSFDVVPVALPDNNWNTVRFHFEGFDIDIDNHLNSIVVDELRAFGEFGLLSVTR